MTTERNPDERQFLFEADKSRKKHGEPPLTPEQEKLYLSQAGTLGMVETSQPTGQAFHGATQAAEDAGAQARATGARLSA